MERQEVGSGPEDEEGPLDVDSQLSCKRYFTERVEFAPAHYPDTHLKEKHLPINALNEKMESSSLSSPPPPPPPPVIQSEILKPKKVLFDPGHLQMKWVESRSIGSGLGNMGNTCFLNSVLQCLSYTPPLVNFMLSGEHKNNCVHQGFCAMCEFHCHLVRIRKSMGVVKPLPIVHNLRVFAKHFRNGHQEDAHEFLRYFIDSLQKISLIGHQPSKLDMYSKHTTVIHQIFGGYHRSQVKCLKCKRTSDTYDPLLDISLDIKGCPSLLKALQSSIKPDLLDEENKYACPFCKELTRAKKQLTVHTLPNVLTIQLKRFEFNTLFGGKINKIVQYPEYLNMRPFMSDKEGPAEWYRLYAVLVHYGYSCHSGHYYCYVKNSNGIWYSMNDSLVSQVSLNTVLTQQAYLLFYIKDPECVRNTSLPSSPTVSPFTLKKQASNVSAIGVPVKRSNNEQAPPTPSKPTGVVTPSPKCTVTPPPAPPLPVPPRSNDTKSFITGKKNSFDLFKSQSTLSNKPSQLMKPKTPTTPPPMTTPAFQTPEMASSKCSVTATPSSLTTPPTAPVTTPFTNFTPRAVAMSKSKFIAAEEPNKPKKPQARVPPMRSKPNTKPVARVKPSPQQVDQPTTETSSTSNTVKDRTEDTVASNNDVTASPSSKGNISKEDPKSKEKEDTNSKDDEVVKTQCDSSKQEWTVSDSLPPPSSPVKFGPSLPPDLAQSSSPNWVVTDLKEHQPPPDEKPKKSKKHSGKRGTPEDSSSESSDTDEELVVKKKGKESKRKDKEIKRNKREDREREKERGKDRLKDKGKEKTKEKDDRDHLKSGRDYTKNREDKEKVKERDHRDKERDHSKKRLKDKNRDRKNKEREDRDQRKQSKSKRHRERSSSSEDDENEFQRKRKKSAEHSKKKHKRHHNKSSRHHSYYSESSDDDEEEDDGRRHKRQRSPPPLLPHHTHSKPWDNDRNRRGDRDKHRQAQRGIEEMRRRRETDKTFDELVKSKGSGSVTEIKWDSTRRSYHHNIHHHSHHDHDSSSPGNVLDSLDKSDQLGSKVKRWDGEKNSIDSSQQQSDSRRRRGRDDWDREIDKGKIKKSKIKHDDDESWGSKNKFQSYQNKRNLKKF